MPHSSGGGSHGGGSHGGHHGGSHYSGYRSNSYSHRSATSRRRTSYHTRRYVYYHRNTPNYVYAGSDFKPGFTLFKVLFIIIILAAGFFLLRRAIPHVPKYSDHKIVIKDEVNVIGNKDDIMPELEAFQKKTGITPSIITIPNEKWMSGYASLEDYAYDRYLSEFSDEMHWLIVYSQPDIKQSKRMYWYWEGMQGDNTDNVLTSSYTKHFNSLFQAYLSDNESFDTSVARSFNYLTNNISMAPDPVDLIAPILLFLFAVILLIRMTYHAVKYRKIAPAPPGPDTDEYTSVLQDGNESFPAYDPNKYLNTYSGGAADSMPSLDGLAATADTSNSERLLNCQYCGCSFTAKQDRCPFCNAKR